MSEKYNNINPNEILNKVSQLNEMENKKDITLETNQTNSNNPLDEKILIKVKLLDDSAEIPTYGHVDKETGENEGDVGMDMKAVSVEYDEVHDQYIYHTGLSVESEKHYGMFLFPRSSNRKTDVYLTNSVGIVDSAIYRGEVLFCYKDRISTYERSNIAGQKAFIRKLLSTSLFQWFNPVKVIRDAYSEYNKVSNRVIKLTKKFEFAPYKVGDKIGQLVVMPFRDVEFEKVDKLSETSRGTGGFGSTGK